MGSKIPHAKLHSGQQRSALQYEQEPVGNVFCPSPGCNAQLTFVARHERQYVSKTIEIAPSFRLRQKQVHNTHCRYDLKGQIDIIARNSNSEVFESIGQNKYIFRLHILLKALREHNAAERKARESGPEMNSSPNKSYSNRGRLSNYLKTLKQILELRSLCEANQDLKKIITLKRDNKTLTWDKFFFDHDNLATFVNVHGADSYTMPVAISGHIKEIHDPSEKFDFHVVELNSPFIAPDDDGIIHKPIPKIILKNKELVKKLDRDKEYIFFGSWKASLKPWQSKDGSKWSYQNIEMYISHEDHFIGY